MEEKFRMLENKVKRLQYYLAASILMLLLLIIIPLKSGSQDLIRTKGLIVEDAAGKPFLMMGNPIPREHARKRKDSLCGLVFVDDKGIDRLFLGRDGKLQIGGELVERNAEGWSFVINDTLGDERGGFGFADEYDRIGLGLDYGGKQGLEAIYLSAAQKQAYITINADVTKGTRDRIVLWHDTNADLSQIKLGDDSADDRLILKAFEGKPHLLHRKGDSRNDLCTD